MLQQRLTRNLYTGQTEPLTAPLSFDFTEDLGDKRNSALLSAYVGATAAYSLRALGSYNGKVVRVRRESDNDEKDFTASDVSSGALTNWVNTQVVPPLDIGVETLAGRVPVSEGGTSIGEPSAAYSLRNLKPSYTGDVVDVRRSSDDATASFNATEVADGTLEDWVTEEITAYTQTGDLNIPAGSGIYTAPLSPTTPNSAGKRYRVTFELKRNSGGDGTTTTSPSLRTTSSWSYSDYTNSSNLSPSSHRFNINQATEEYQTYTLTYTTDEGSAPWPLRFQTYDSNDSYTVRNFTIEILGQDGFVSIWYDQSTAENDAEQTDPTKQPKIVDGGSLVTGGLTFDGVNDYFTCPSLYSANLSVFTKVTTDNNNSANFMRLLHICDGSDSFQITRGGNEEVGDFLSKNTSFQPASVSFNHGSISGNSLLTSITSGSATQSYANGSLRSNGSDAIGDGGNATTTIGARSDLLSSSFFNNAIAEIIIYDSDQTDNRTAIEANIGETYGITGIPAYDNTVSGFVETWYDQSGNGNNATQFTAENQPKIVDGGVYLGEVEFDGTNDVLETTNSDLSNQSSLSLFSVLQGRTASGTRYAVSAGSTVSGNSNNQYGGWAFSSDGYGDAFRFRTQESGNASISSLDSQVVGTGYYSVTSIINDADGSIFKDGQVNETISTVVTPYNLNEQRRRLRIGCFHPTTNTFFYQGGMKEIILYTSDQSANRTGIEDNINNHYDIY